MWKCVSILQSDLQQLATEFDATVQRLETALRFAAPVHFGFDDATVRSQDRELLQRFSSVVGEHYPDALITVEGFTDPSGSAAYNLRLGQRRADAVKAFLVDQGRLSGDRIRTVSYGEDTSRLVDANAMGPGETGIANRRVVMVIEHASAAQRPAVITDATIPSGGAGN
jgi:peptidoglycan-associated lipoprotein